MSVAPTPTSVLFMETNASSVPIISPIVVPNATKSIAFAFLAEAATRLPLPIIRVNTATTAVAERTLIMVASISPIPRAMPCLAITKPVAARTENVKPVTKSRFF